VPVIAIPLAFRRTPRRLTNRVKIFLEKNFLGKADTNTRRLGEKNTPGAGSIEGTGAGTTTFTGVVNDACSYDIRWSPQVTDIAYVLDACRMHVASTGPR
jgi:hypothetical protein